MVAREREQFDVHMYVRTEVCTSTYVETAERVHARQRMHLFYERMQRFERGPGINPEEKYYCMRTIQVMLYIRIRTKYMNTYIKLIYEVQIVPRCRAPFKPRRCYTTPKKGHLVQTARKGASTLSTLQQ